MSREQSLHRGAALMVLGALIFLVYAVVFFFRAFSSSPKPMSAAPLCKDCSLDIVSSPWP